MKMNYLIIIVFNFIIIYNVKSWEQFNPKNSNLKSPRINNIVKDSNNELIFMSNSEVGFINGSEIISDTIYRTISDMYPISNCIDDGIGNLIFRSDNAVGIRNKTTNKWQIISDKTIPGLLFRNSIVQIDKDIYVNASLFNTLYKLEYNNETKKYQIDKQKPKQSNNLLDNEFGYNMCYIDSLLIFGNNKGLSIFDLKTNEVKIISNIESISLNYNDIKGSIFLKILNNKLIVGVKTNDSTLTLLISEKNIRDELKFKKYNYTTKVINPQTFEIYDIEEYEDNKFILSCLREMLILDNGIFYNLNKPSILGEDINLEWLPRTIEILNKDIYIGTFQGGIFKATLEELLSLKIGTSVEKDLKTNNLIVFPNPTSDFLIINEENINKIEIYDLIGNKVIETNYNETPIYKVQVNELSKGLYQVVLYKLTGEILNTSFIKN